jgi:FkbM family methyltransferase
MTMRILKKVCNQIGFDIVRSHNSPVVTLLGLRRFPIRTVIDVGANEGQFAKQILGFFPHAHLYCFEPLPEPFKKLRDWAEGQQGNVDVFNVALGETEGTIEMLSHVEHNTSSSLLRTTARCEELYPFTHKQAPLSIKLMPLDKIVVNLPQPLVPELLIKLDVQGYEDRVIRGGTETIRKARACIIEINLDELYENQATFKDLLLSLRELGFHYAGNLDQVYGEDGHVISLDAVFVRQH